MKKAAGPLFVVLVLALCACEGRAFPTIGTITDTTVSGGTILSSATVRIVDNAYQPNIVNLLSGGLVVWVWDSSASLHNVTFADASQSSPTQSRGTHSLVFGSVGTFTYHCTIHAEMTGSIVVH
ncbi:MAG TPA: hypothetical protein VGU74_15555 [Gemmatimonadales bacterium]|nr:hypothetical protein [Gemmatimonadales bacterium]